MKNITTGILLSLQTSLTAIPIDAVAQEFDQTTTNEKTYLLTGDVQGSVQSELINVEACQIYLYDKDETELADAFDSQHPEYVQPDTAIMGGAPLATETIDRQGKYNFSNISVGSYKLVLNCHAAGGVQDESLLSDDPIQYQGFRIPNPDGIIPNTKMIKLVKNKTITVNFKDERVKTFTDNTSDVVVFADISNPHSHQKLLHNMWNTVNRISPKNGVKTIDGLKVNLVRMLGGINKKVGGKKVPDISYDPAFLNETTQTYEYNFKPLISRIDAILTEGKEIHQIVLDQPPWAFQTGFTFIPADQKDGKNFRENERVSHYGNSLPPKNKDAYNKFLQATMRSLIDEYGRDRVLSWRFRIGSEIETPNHWYGTEQDFVEHFANSVNAIRKVLPEAKIGLHTRGPQFVYKNGTVTNYKNEPIKSFDKALIEYCFDNNIKYDFWGVSDYPFINNVSTRNPKTKFKHFFEPLVTNPKWQKGTVIDIEEFSIITKMGGIPEAAFITSHSPQADTYFVALTDNFYQNGVDQVFQWGLRDGEKPWRMTAFQNMINQTRIETTTKDSKGNKVDTVGAITVSNPKTKAIQAIAYNYDPKDIDAVNGRAVKLSFVIEAPTGTQFTYRKKLAAPEHHAFYSFMSNAKAETWLKDGTAYSKYGNPDIVLNKRGKKAWKNYEHTNVSQWSKWKTATTVSRGTDTKGSLIMIDGQLPLFSFEKTEIKY